MFVQVLVAQEAAGNGDLDEANPRIHANMNL